MPKSSSSLLSPLLLSALYVIVVIFTALPLKCAAAPVQESSTDIQPFAEGCYYNYNHYKEGDRILTNEPCLNCTCHNSMLMCYLKVCPFAKPVGHDCKVERREDQCCPIITCPEVPVELLSHQAESSSTELDHPFKYGCKIGGHYYSEGAQVPSDPNKPCELCYCIRNRTSCIMQECTLHVEGCQPIYQEGSCCPARYNCDYDNENELWLEEGGETQLTTERPSTGFILTTTLTPILSSECSYNSTLYRDGASISTEDPCQHCYCMHGDIVCAVQNCAVDLDNETKNCTAVMAVEERQTECCPRKYICKDITSSEGGDALMETNDTAIMGKPLSETTVTPVLATTVSILSADTTAIYDSSSDAITTTEKDYNKVETSTNSVPEISISLQNITEEDLQLQGHIDDNHKETGYRVVDGETTTMRLPIHEHEEITMIPYPLTTISRKETTLSMAPEITTLLPDVLAPKLNRSESEGFTDFSTPAPIDKKESTSETYVELTTVKAEEEDFEIETSTQYEKLDVTTSLPLGEKTEEVLKENEDREEEEEGTTPVHKPFYENEIIPIAIPGEGDCLVDEVTYRNNSSVPPDNACFISCVCSNSVVNCKAIDCNPPERSDCVVVNTNPEACCPEYNCEEETTDKFQAPSMETTTAGDLISNKKATSPSDSEISLTTIAPESQEEELSISNEILVKESMPTTVSITEEIPLATTVSPWEKEPGLEKSTRRMEGENLVTEIPIQGSVKTTTKKVHLESTTTQIVPIKSSEKPTEIYEEAPVTEVHKKVVVTPEKETKIVEQEEKKNEILKPVTESETDKMDSHLDEMITTLASSIGITERSTTETVRETTETYGEIHKGATDAVPEEDKITRHEVTTEYSSPQTTILQENLGEENKPETEVKGSTEIFKDETTEHTALETQTTKLSSSSESSLSAEPLPSTEIPFSTKIPLNEELPSGTEQGIEHEINEEEKTMIPETDTKIIPTTTQKSEEIIHTTIENNEKFTTAPTVLLKEEEEKEKEKEEDKHGATTERHEDEEGITEKEQSMESSTIAYSEISRITEVPQEVTELNTQISMKESHKEHEHEQEQDLSEEKITTVLHSHEKEGAEYTTESIIPTTIYKGTEILSSGGVNKLQEHEEETKTETQPFETTTELGIKIVEKEEGEIVKEGEKEEDAEKEKEEEKISEERNKMQITTVPSLLEGAEITTESLEEKVTVSHVEQGESLIDNAGTTTENVIITTVSTRISSSNASSEKQDTPQETFDHTTMKNIEENINETTPKEELESISHHFESVTIQTGIESTTVKEAEKESEATTGKPEIETDKQEEDKEKPPSATTEISTGEIEKELETRTTTLGPDTKLNEATESTGTSKSPESSELPEQVTTSPQEITIAPEEITASPEKVTKSPEGMTILPEEVTTSPEEITTSPEEITTSPEKVTKSSEEITTSPEEVTTSPEGITTSPEKVTTSPEEITTSPEKVTSPEEITTSPEKVTKSPEEINLSPEEVTISPEKVMTSPEEITKSPEELTTIESTATTKGPHGVKPSLTSNEILEEEIQSEIIPTTEGSLDITTVKMTNKTTEEEAGKPFVSITETHSLDHTTVEPESAEKEETMSTTIPSDIAENQTTTKVHSISIDSSSTSTTEKALEQSFEKVDNLTTEKEVVSSTEPSEQRITTHVVDLLSLIHNATTEMPLIYQSGEIVTTIRPDTYENINMVIESVNTTEFPFSSISTLIPSTTMESFMPISTERVSDLEKVTEKDSGMEIASHTHQPELSTTGVITKTSTVPPASTTTKASSTTAHPAAQPYPSGYGQISPHYPSYPEDDYIEEDEGEVFGPGTCRYGGKLFVSAQQIPRDDPCDFCFCFRSDIICLQQSCPPPISGCHEEPIQGFCCPRYECPVSLESDGTNSTGEILNSSTYTTSLPLNHHQKHHQRQNQQHNETISRGGCLIQGKYYKVGEKVHSSSGPCMKCTCGSGGQMQCDPEKCTPEPMLRQMVAVVGSRRRR